MAASAVLTPPLLDLVPPIQPPFDFTLEAALGRLVIPAIRELIGKAGHPGHRVLLVVRVLVALP